MLHSTFAFTSPRKKSLGDFFLRELFSKPALKMSVLENRILISPAPAGMFETSGQQTGAGF
jgi:hypothetical protein